MCPDNYHNRLNFNKVFAMYNSDRVITTEYTELQPLLSGVHSVMREKSVLAGEGGGARPPPLLTSKVAVYAPAEWADTLTLFHLYQYMYSVVTTYLKFKKSRNLSKAQKYRDGTP